MIIDKYFHLYGEKDSVNFVEIPKPTEPKTTDRDLISRESVITMLQKIENAVEDGDGFQFNEWIDYAKDIPSAEKTAEWEIVGKTTLHYECSICGGAGDKWDSFCKHCGAKMQESEEKE